MPGSVPRDGAWTLMRHLDTNWLRVSRATAESALGWTGRCVGQGHWPCLKRPGKTPLRRRLLGQVGTGQERKLGGVGVGDTAVWGGRFEAVRPECRKACRYGFHRLNM